MKRRFQDFQVKEIRSQYARGIGQKALSLFWNVNRKSIQDIVHGRTYKEVGGEMERRVRVCPSCRQIVKQTGVT